MQLDEEQKAVIDYLKKSPHDPLKKQAVGLIMKLLEVIDAHDEAIYIYQMRLEEALKNADL